MWKKKVWFRIVGIVRMAALRLLPRDHVAGVLDDPLARLDRLQGEHALAVDARASHLGASARARRGFGETPGAFVRVRLLWVH
jgi:hypothetical protein